ncbi:MAG: VWA domain-containing protein [Archangium sp.]|nr:VWA domain-containing protein [Archangium sp.]
MGYGSYSYEAHQAITTSRAGQSAAAVFKGTVVDPKMDPKGVKYRESRDSKDNPDSLGIVFALDISGSMSSIPVDIATKQLPGFMKLLTDAKVASPQVLFACLTDVTGDGRPLQVGQFETTAELMDQWLTRCSLKGGGDELYELAFHFFARHTAMDCWEKRQRKGYLFMTGDEPSNTTLSGALVKRWLGTDQQDMPLEAVIADVRRTFHPFFIAPDRKRGAGVSAFWTPYLGDSFISLDDPADTCAAAAGLVALGEGAVKGLAQLEASLTASGNTRAKQVVEALRPWAAANGKA